MNPQEVFEKLWNRFENFTYMFWRDAYNREAKAEYDLKHLGYKTRPDPYPLCGNCGRELEPIGWDIGNPLGPTIACRNCVPQAFHPEGFIESFMTSVLG